MAFTAKKLSELSGVSTRTLRWYDTVNLLKPAFYGDENNYRYYETEQLQKLQKILYLRELDFKLEEIKEIIEKGAAEQINIFKKQLKEMERKNVRNQTIVNILKMIISNEEADGKIIPDKLFTGFKEWISGKDESDYYIGEWDNNIEISSAEKLVMNNLKSNVTDNWAKEDFENHVNEANNIYHQVVAKMLRGYGPDDKSIVDLIEQHYTYAEKFHHLNHDIYYALADLYRLKPEFKIQLVKHHQHLPEFISMAMKFYSIMLKNNS